MSTVGWKTGYLLVSTEIHFLITFIWACCMPCKTTTTNSLLYLCTRDFNCVWNKVHGTDATDVEKIKVSSCFCFYFVSFILPHWLLNSRLDFRNLILKHRFQTKVHIYIVLCENKHFSTNFRAYRNRIQWQIGPWASSLDFFVESQSSVAILSPDALEWSHVRGCRYILPSLLRCVFLKVDLSKNK